MIRVAARFHRRPAFQAAALAVVLTSSAAADPGSITFTPSAAQVEAYDFLEVSIAVEKPDAANPFTDVVVEGAFQKEGDSVELRVDGFCDSADGAAFRIRFLPDRFGRYSSRVVYRQGTFEKTWQGSFEAVNGKRRGILRVDPHYRFHFIWEGTGEHFFLNGTTAFLLMGWDDEKVIRDCLSRFRKFKVNRVRVLLDGRTDHSWTEPVKAGNGYRSWLNPWVAERPDDVLDPGFDYARFNAPYWQKYERMLRHARDLDINISVIFGWNDTKVHPSALSDDEKRYFRYASARLGAFSNVTWDLGDDLDSYRSEEWTHAMGTLLKGWDPYRHLATSHPAISNEHQDRASDWFGMTSFQEWHRPLHGWMLAQRLAQDRAGRIIPQINEEYGYEDHYPEWNPVPPPGCDVEGNRRTAWGMCMAGTYQTTGETAKRGTNFPPDTGGGWINGRGDPTMKQLEAQVPMVNFFTSFQWWRTEPHDELVDPGMYCLAAPGEIYAVYLPKGGQVHVQLEPGTYQATWLDPRTGKTARLESASGPVWTSAPAPDGDDGAILLLKKP
jgi:uncharacterized protein DUF4038/uncharacterized protein DUF5060